MNMNSKKRFRLYDASKIDKKNLMFHNRALAGLLFPIIIEQILNSFMGMADTMMVSNVGSTAISAVSLVDSVNTLVIQVFSAMATGAAIICSQYLGNQDIKGCNRAAKQVFLTVFAISTCIMLFGILFRVPLLHLVFGEVEEAVMQQSLIYFLITVLSYPFFALFSAGSAFFRAGGNSGFPMRVSLISNVMNIAGNAVLIFGFHMGVEGAALSTLVSRIFSMAVVFWYLAKPNQQIILRDYASIRPDMGLIKKILAISVPTGIENGMFQFGKLAIQSTVSTMGTTAIAAQAMTNILENVNGVVGIGIGIGLMTVVGQCIGAGKREEAKYYMVKLTAVAEAGIFLSCLFAYGISGIVTHVGGMEPESAALCIYMIGAITIVKPISWTLSFIPAYGMRAAGDVRFSMLVSTCTMWCCRVALCIFLVKMYHMGPMAVWYGMFADWTIRAFIFSGRFISGRWLKNSLV